MKYIKKNTFGLALDYLLKLEGRGSVSNLSVDTGIDQGHLSNIRNLRTSPGIGKACAIADALSVSLDEMLRIGRWFLDGKVPDLPAKNTESLPTVVRQHSSLVARFQNHKLAKEINEKLIDLERNDPAELNYILGIIDSRLANQGEDGKDSQGLGG